MVRTPNVRRVASAVRALPIGNLLVVPARVAGFAGAQAVRARRAVDPSDVLPATAPTRGLVAQVLLDELVLALMKRPDRLPTTAEIERVVAELQVTLDLYRAHGWDADPRAYHVDPPALVAPTITRERWLHTTFERLTWLSGYEPWPGLPGRGRWLADERNRTASAVVLRHADQTRPWVVCLHGLGTGMPAADLPGFRVRHLHRDLGLNVILPVLPKHGPRGPGRLGAQTVLSYDHGDAVLAVAQALYDVRQVIGWARRESRGAVAAHGISLGGLVASLLAAHDPDLAAVVAGIPVVDIPNLFRAHVPWRLRRRPWLADMLGETAAAVHRVISPLAFEPAVSPERLYLYAGVGDRMVPTPQAVSLARQWQGSSNLWFPGDHIGAGWSREVRQFVDAALLDHLSPTPGAATAAPATGQRR